MFVLSKSVTVMLHVRPWLSMWHHQLALWIRSLSWNQQDIAPLWSQIFASANEGMELPITNDLEELNGLKIPGDMCLDGNMGNLFCAVLQRYESAEHRITWEQIWGVEITWTASQVTIGNFPLPSDAPWYALFFHTEPHGWT